MELLVVAAFFIVFGWFGVVAWCELLAPSRLEVVAAGGGATLLASIRSVVVLDDEVLIELCPEPGGGARCPRWFRAALVSQSSFLERWRDQRRAVEVITDTELTMLRRGTEEVRVSALPDA